MYYVGIDIAKNNHQSSIIDTNGEMVCESLSLSNTIKGFEKLIKYLESYEVTPENCIIGMEATGHYWLSIYSYLLELGYQCVVINPIQSEAFRRMEIRRSKTDIIDSKCIAEVMRFGKYSSSNISDEATYGLRNLSRYRYSLVDECSDWKRRLISILDQVFPEYSKLFSDVYGVSSKNILSKYPLPEDMLKVSATELGKLLSKCSNGYFGKDKAEEIQQAALSSVGIKFSQKTFSFEIKQIIEKINFLENQISEIEKEMSSMLQEQCPIITSITGIGDTLGAVIYSEIGDIKRFERPNQLVAYSGIDSTVNQSGEYKGNQNKMSKRGSPYLRRAIWLAANVAAFKDPALSLYYQKLRQRGKAHGTAIGAVARKLTNIIFAVLRDNKAYIPNI
ncbi:IS110 family transposase [Anaerococcus sp. NML200537]|uniref:IS110 family transposase n=1 Tax=Anaerococcus sp. NML200537 TaxID=2954485 RepID=UPI00223749F8|nr:IS110 family transposase [Anaerococcus sp. NML200537]MCW6700959.1 IS110 family transposase [Anaerococcus sp. NML200537]